MPTAEFHRRPLPPDLIDFSSPQGRKMLGEALAAGSAEAFFPLVAQLHTQAEPAWCGLGTLVTVLNALDIDPGRTWKGPWRWFGEELLGCCKSVDVVAAEGLTLDELACLARCNGAQVDVHHADPEGYAAFHSALLASCRAPAGPFLVSGYDRKVMGQTGTGHFSPLAAWHPDSDQVLVLDVARFKYPPHWAPVSRLWAAMRSVDPDSGQPRGWMSMSRAEELAVPKEAPALLERLEAMGAEKLPCCPKPR